MDTSVRKIGITICNIFLTVLLCVSVNANGQKLSMCWHDAPPYSGPMMKDGGYVADLVRSVFVRAGYQPEIQFLPWARCVSQVKKKNIDLVFSMWENVDVHQQHFDFLNNSSIDEVGFIVLSDSRLTSGKLSDFPDINVAVHIKGGFNQELLNHPRFTYQYANSDLQKIKMLIFGRVDMTIMDIKRANYVLKNQIKTDHRKKLRALKPLIRVDYASPAILKTNPHKHKIIKNYNRAYKKMCNEGFMNSLRKKHKVAINQRDCDSTASQ